MGIFWDILKLLLKHTCQKSILCVGILVGTPSGHIGRTIYAANLSFALILFAILRAISIGIKLFAPESQSCA